MAQVQFPSSPSDGDLYTVNDVTYTWNNTAGLWEANNATALADTFVAVAGDTMTGNLELPGGGGSTQALQSQEISALIAASGGGGGDLQTVTDAGNTTTNGIDIGSGNIELNADGTGGFNGTGSLGVPVGTTAERPSMTPGDLRWNSTTGYTEIGTAAGAFKQLAYVSQGATLPSDLNLSGTVEMASAYYVNDLTIAASSILTPASGITYITATGDVTIGSGCAFNFEEKGVLGGSGGASAQNDIVGQPGRGISPGSTLGNSFSYGPSVPITSFMSSSGASGRKATTSSANPSQDGGAAGGTIVIMCLGSITVGANCTFNVNGQDANSNGANTGTNYGGAGGGAGGFIVLQSRGDLIIDSTVTMTANGGDGANGSQGGGGGGGGYIVLGSIGTYTATMTTAPTLTGGAIGAGSGGGSRGGDGGNGGGSGGSNSQMSPALPAQDGQLLTNFILGGI